MYSEFHFYLQQFSWTFCKSFFFKILKISQFVNFLKNSKFRIYEKT